MPEPRTQNLLTRVAMTVAVVALPFSMLSVWVNAFVTDSDRYVDTVRPLAKDPAVKKAAVTYIERETLKALDDSDQIGDTLRSLDLSCLGVDSSALGGIADLISGFLDGTPLGTQLQAQVRPLIEPVIHKAIVAAVDGPAFERIWVSANTQAHDQALDVLNGRAPRSAAVDVLIPLQQMVNVFTAGLDCQNLVPPTLAQQIAPSLTLVNTEDLDDASTGYQVLDALHLALPIVFVLALIIAVVAARPRRRAVWQLGIGFVLGTLLLYVVMALTKSTITSRGIDKGVFDAVWDAITNDLANATAGTLVASGIILTWTWPEPAVPAGQPAPSDQPRLYVKGAATVLLVVAFLLLVSR